VTNKLQSGMYWHALGSICVSLKFEGLSVCADPVGFVVSVCLSRCVPLCVILIVWLGCIDVRLAQRNCLRALSV